MAVLDRPMDFLASIFVGRPLNILGVSLLFLAAFVVARVADRGASMAPKALLIGAAAWFVYAAWEWVVLVRTPEADIRVDLLVIWPLVALFSIVSVWKTFR